MSNLTSQATIVVFPLQRVNTTSRTAVFSKYVGMNYYLPVFIHVALIFRVVVCELKTSIDKLK